MEVVIVLLILGVLAVVAAPSFMDLGDQATDRGLRKTLRTIRDAIDLYKAETGEWPGASTGTAGVFKDDVKPYLRKDKFPPVPVGPKKGNAQVRMRNAGVPLSGNPTPNRGWKYDYTTGEFIVNFNGFSSDGVTRYEDF